MDIASLQTIAKRLRLHSLRATTQAGSGHPTSCLSAADLTAALFFHTLRFDPENPKDARNDRFVLSKGHAAPLLWALFAEVGLIPEEELLTLRSMDSPLEGHPTPRFPWVDVATGSLGQGLSVGVGMALNARFLDQTDARVFVLLGDGECAEGSVWEAAALASFYHLNNLVALVDVNQWGQSQATMYGYDLERYAKKFESCGFSAICIDGHEMKAVVQALDAACASKEKPTAIIAKTVKGKGVSLFENKEGWHGKALSQKDLEKAIQELESSEKITVSIAKPSGPTPVKGICEKPILPQYPLGEKIATRAAYGDALVQLGEADSRVVALDGDTKNSTFSEKFLKAFPSRFFECFIAEQNMVGVAAGLAARGKIPFASTFGAFLSRAHDQVRMTGISQLPIKLCGSHAGVSIGEDGPSQMALEDLAMMRTVPQMAVLYPSDAVACVKLVAESLKFPSPVYLRTGRPATPVIYSNEEDFPIGGLKILKQSPKDCATVVSAGITLFEALKAYELLQKKGVFIRVIDLYSIKPIDKHSLLEAAKVTKDFITVEDHYPEGGLGEATASVLAPFGFRVHMLAVNQIPRSAKPEELLALCGVDAAAIIKKVESL